MPNNLRGIQKIAVLLTVIGEESSSKVMAGFDSDEQMRIGQAMVELEDAEIGEDVVQSTLDEFRQMLASGVAFRAQFGKALGKMFTKLYGNDEATKRVSRIREDSKSRFPFRPLMLLRPGDLARLLREEHAQVQALVLSNLDPDYTADVLNAIPEEERAAIVTRMATMEDPPPRVMKQVANDLIERSRGLPRSSEGHGGTEEPKLRVVADVLNASPKSNKEILKKVEEKDTDLGTRIRERMFTWSDLKLLDKRTIQKVLAGIDTKLLAVSLKASEAAVTDAILGATSQRTKDMISEEKELLGSMPLAEVLEAQRQVLTTVREMMMSGEIQVSKGNKAAYVS